MGLFKKKPTVDPADFLALRAELQDVKARLDASEQAKAYLEARLGSLDATTSALTSASTARNTELGEQLTALTSRLNLTESETSKVAVLLARVADVEERQREAAAIAAAVPDTVEAVPAEDLTPRLEALAARLDEVAEQAARVEQSTADALAAASAAAQPTAGEAPAEPSAPAVDEALVARVEQLAARTEAIDHIAHQVESLAQRMSAQAEMSHELDLLNARIGELQANAGATDEIRMRVERIAEQAANATTTDTSALADQLAQLAERVAMNVNETKQAREQAAALDARIASVSTELANQLNELGHEIDALAAREVTGDGGGQVEMSDEVLDALRTGQTRLASEQARYEIAFREDLAELAEQLRILRGR